MLLLVVVGLFVAVASEPQAVLPMGYNVMPLHNGQPLMPYAYSPIQGAYVVPASPAVVPTSPGVIPMGHNIIYPSLDITMARSSSVDSKPDEDTPEMEKAKMDVETAYEKSSLGVQPTQVFRARRQVNRVMPYGYTLPYAGYMTPYGRIAHQVPSSPSSVVPPNVFQSPYVTHY